MRRKNTSLLAVLVVGITTLGVPLLPVTALAIPYLTFDLDDDGGTLSYLGGSAPLIGSGIPVKSVKGKDTPNHAGEKRDCILCVLNFRTGPSTGSWMWGGGDDDFITITGGIDLNKNGIVDSGVEPSGFLLSGSFGHVRVERDDDSHDDEFEIEAWFLDMKDHRLTEFYGLPDGLYLGSFDLEFEPTGSPSPGDAFSGSEIEGHVRNTLVPEPASLLLLGSGLIGLGLLGRRKL